MTLRPGRGWTAGIVSKVKVSRRGKQHGGQPFGHGALYHLVQNRLYLGEIVHKDQTYPGQHPAIVPKDLWDQVQQALAANRTQHHGARAEGSAHLLAGRLWDDCGHLVVPTYTRKANGQQYRYYVSQCLMDPSKGSAGSVARISAEAIGQLVEKEVRDRLPLTEQKRWRSASQADRSTRLRSYVAKVIIRENDVEIQRAAEVRQLSTRAQPSSAEDKVARAITVPVTMKLAASGKPIVSLDGTTPQESRVGKALLRAVVRANRWRELLETGVARSAYDLARLESCRVRYVQRHLPFAFLAPDIVETIVAGRQPRSWMLSDMITDTACLSWNGYRPK